MKTMTCRQLGGPCDHAFHANTADEVIKAEDRHLKETVASGDETHKSALQSMRGRWKNPISGMGWYMTTRKAFAALPED
jgi:predicted small metal-binding protein